ncbi:tail completion protein gp17 [Bacillus altitudinis]|uniref:tail completion protein gp17 n=1 Tax=Bacillus altitudinis TaxID=293387 RepID=UPI0037ED1F89|nr:DUF3168 domain-containing protein [Bacillus altitudinis]
MINQNLIRRADTCKNAIFEALENDPALLSLIDKGDIYELAVPEGTKSSPPYVVLQEINYKSIKWADNRPIQDSATYQIDVYHNADPQPIMAAIGDVMERLDFAPTIPINDFLEKERLIRKGYRFEKNIILGG